MSYNSNSLWFRICNLPSAKQISTYSTINMPESHLKKRQIFALPMCSFNLYTQMNTKEAAFKTSQRVFKQSTCVSLFVIHRHWAIGDSRSHVLLNFSQIHHRWLKKASKSTNPVHYKNTYPSQMIWERYRFNRFPFSIIFQSTRNFDIDARQS